MKTTKFKRIISACVSVALLATTLISTAVPSSAISYSGSNSYKSGKYYSRLVAVSKTGNQRTDVVNVAKSQIGYQEGGSSSQLSGTVRGNGNYTEYGKWYGVHTLWCAMFVSWCTSVAGVSQSVMPKHSYTVTGVQWFQNRGQSWTRSSVAAGKYRPQAGDIVYFKSSRNANIVNHIGIVTKYSGSTLYTVEGNTSSATISTNGGAVAAKSYDIDNTYIRYICVPKYKGSSSSSDSDVSTFSVSSDYASVKARTTTGSTTYYKKVSSSYTSIVSALNSIGADSSFANRMVIAKTNGFAAYSGTPAQNTEMLSLLKAGKLIMYKGVSSGSSDSGSGSTSTSATYFPKYTGSATSLNPALEALGIDNSKSYRAKIAAANGITNYTYTPEQNTQMLNLLKQGKLINPDGKVATTTTTTTTTTNVVYYPKYTGSSGSIVTALEAIGVDSSKAHRAKIAAANGITDYTYTPEQNTQMVNLLKKGKLINPDKTTTTTTTTTSSNVSYYKSVANSYTSIVTALKKIGVDSSKEHRAKIAAANGIANYTYTPAQNIQMLDLLKDGKLIKPSCCC